MNIGEQGVVGAVLDNFAFVKDGYLVAKSA
jgi:hypothetical protein